MKNLFLLIALLSVANIAVAVTSGSDAAKPAETTKVPHGGMASKADSGLPPGHPGSIPADTSLMNSGKVLEVLDSDMYTYVQVTTDKDPLWLAAYKTDITKGATVKYSGGIAMTKFFSKALNRTFELIVFVDSLEQVKK
jgi:hypothetical protein